MGDEPTDRDARKVVQRRQHRIQNLPADILEVNIDPVRTGRFQTFSQLGLAMVDERGDPGRQLKVCGSAAMRNFNNSPTPEKFGSRP
jgi:hypothetical protein